MFGSSAYMPIASMPGWVQAIATVNPLTYAIDASRALALATPAGGAVLAALTAAVLVAGVCAALAGRNFRRAE